MGPDGDLVEARLGRGCRCFAVWIEGAAAGYGWLSTGPEWISEIQLEITPREREGYVWDCATVVKHRRKGIFRSVLVGISEAARREGLQRLWIGTIEIPAEKALPQAGFKPALRFRAKKLGGWHVLRADRATSDPKLLAAARAVLKPRADWLIRRSESRRH